jgi:hypothetical protein
VQRGAVSPRGERSSQVPFQSHIELLQLFLIHREAIVERIQAVLAAERTATDFLQSRSLLSRHFEDCFFAFPDVAAAQPGLRGQLEDAHWASGFRPRELPGLYNGLADPVEMTIRVFHLWRQTRWPGRSARVRYAHTLFNLYVIRCLELLSMHLWEAGLDDAGARLAQLQGVLDRLWASAPADQPVLVRDARWLIQLAQSPATDELGAYFDVAEKIASSFSSEDRLAIHGAGVRMTSGHLRSQTRHYSTKTAAAFDDESVTRNTRTTNALDFALLIQELVPLLEAYRLACDGGDAAKRIELAGIICQGVSPDPELFLNRIELLGAYSMIEHLFVAVDRDGLAAYTATGRRHVQLIDEYARLIDRVSPRLSEDCARFRPTSGAYSPYGILYGFSSNLLEHIVLKASQPGPATRFSLEDVFADEDTGDGRLAWVTGWRKLPHVAREVESQFEYPQRFADQMFARIERALGARLAGSGTDSVVRTGRLFVVPEDGSRGDSETSQLPELPIEYIESSDPQLVAARKADSYDESRIASDRREGRCLVSYKASGGWVAISKAVLTDVMGAGRDVKIADLPPVAAETLKLMGRGLVVLPAQPAD